MAPAIIFYNHSIMASERTAFWWRFSNSKICVSEIRRYEQCKIRHSFITLRPYVLDVVPGHVPVEFLHKIMGCAFSQRYWEIPLVFSDPRRGQVIWRWQLEEQCVHINGSVMHVFGLFWYPSVVLSRNSMCWNNEPFCPATLNLIRRRRRRLQLRIW